ncbi:MAG: hypothetical protein LCH63_15855 [Candidatus Melainabacteria bacterium]|mgnify:CR=1 FL=1|uniref:Uncharacterized protein n=1 Tax=Candidatus Obscuribacter phosphatis TaxID=1906157 RepID=A0A8J7PHT8_9BACT|nr:hypothetical protein [Candidatus Obscuribacter phosphatis]MBX9940232.1 hypothetical protein [Candidatus Obscuribacterales bacterium]MCA0315290.1 hypothetical protein [Candidatus Melainabacteria bacterium]
MKKSLLTAGLVLGALGAGTASFASGPLTVAPTPVPTKTVMASVNVKPIQTNLLKSYRSVRAFWLSRALVR